MEAQTKSQRTLKAKVSLAGEGRVGKTSLVKRFVLDQFDDIYLQTLGTKVMKKEVRVAMPSLRSDVLVELIIFDTMGQANFRSLFQEAYFYGAKAIIGVFDVTRPDTIRSLETWIEQIRANIGPVPAMVMANKCDLLGSDDSMTQEDVEHTCRLKGWTYHLTSARTGEGVEAAFQSLAKVVANDILAGQYRN